MRKRASLGSFDGPSTAPSTPIPSPVQLTDNFLASCALNIPSFIDVEKLHKLRGKYQFLDDIHTCLLATGNGVILPIPLGQVYIACMLGGLTLPLNAFAREILTRLGIAPNELNPNGWRIIMAMQVLWREFFEGIVLSLWMSSYIAINLLESINPLAFIIFLPKVQTVE